MVGRSQIAITLSEGRRTATTVVKQLAFCEGRSEARRTKHANDCHCRGLCIGLTFALGLCSTKKNSSKTTQKSHVKPRNRLNPSNKTRSRWHVSYTQSGID